MNKLIGTAGPTASGKSLLAMRLSEKLGEEHCLIISQDNYYKDWSHLPKKQRSKINFDDVSSFDFGLFIKHLRVLKGGRPISMPCYSFISYCRLKRTKKVYPKPFIIAEGLMPFIKKKSRELFDLKIYVDIDKAISLARRIKRDIRDRAETIESVCERYFRDVLPMRGKYVEPTKKFADIVVSVEGDNSPDIKKVLSEIRRLRKKK